MKISIQIPATLKEWVTQSKNKLLPDEARQQYLQGLKVVRNYCDAAIKDIEKTK